MAYIGPANSVVAFQGTVPWSVLGAVVTTGSVISVTQGSVATVIIGGSIAASFTPPANQSVSGIVGASIIGLPTVSVSNFPTTQNVSGSVVSFQGGPWANTNIGSVITVGQGSIAVNIIAGSIAASFTPPANQSVSGAVQADIRGSVAAVIIGGSILTTTGNSSVQVLNFPVNQSVSGAVSVSNFPVVAGSVLAFQGGTWSQSVVGQGAAGALTNGWPTINGEANDSTGTFTNATQTTSVTNNNLDGYGNSLVSINGTYGTATAIFEGSDDSGTTWFTVNAARDDLNVIETGYTSLTNTSRSWQINNSGFDSIRVRSTAVASGTVNVRISSSSAPNSSGAIVGIGTALPAGNNIIGSIAAYQGSVPWAMAGSVAAFQAGTIITSITGQLTVVSSLAGGIFPISGSVAAVVTNSVNVNGSVVATQGTNPWIVNVQNSSIFAVPVGSTISVFQNPSIVGTYAEDAPSASGDKGFLVMGARNDTLASVTSNDGDYSSHVVGPAGELVSVNAPFTKWVFNSCSVFTTTSQVALPAQGASIFTYVTAIQISNLSANQVLVTFGHGSNSILGYTTAPANGGSNIVMPNGWKTAQNAPVTASISGGIASVFISVEGFIAKV